MANKKWHLSITTGLKIVNDAPGHYMLTPIRNMPLDSYKGLLEETGVKCQKYLQIKKMAQWQRLDNMSNSNLKSLNIELTERDLRYIIYSLNELMSKLEIEIDQDPDGEEELTPMYADDVLSLRDIRNRLKEMATPVFGEANLTISYETL